MARYNSKRIYNRLIPSGGAIYNSAPFSINIFDYSGGSVDNIKNITRNTNIQDNNITRIEILTFDFSVNINDNIVTLEKTNLLIDTGARIDLGNGQETVINQSNSNYSDTGQGNDNTNLSPLMLLLNELSQHTDNIDIHPLAIALSQTLNINESINIDTVLLDFIDSVNSNENTILNSNVDIEDNSQSFDNLSQIISNILANELGNGVEIISLLPLSINITDINLTTNETVNTNSVIIYNDSGNGIDSITYRLGAFYNTKLSYNKGINNGGNIYNSSKHYLFIVSERGKTSENEPYILQACFVSDKGIIVDMTNIVNTLPTIFDSETFKDNLENIISTIAITDLAKLNFQEKTILSKFIDVIDKMIANDYVNMTETHFMVDAEGVLQPLGIKVTKVYDSILPSIKDYTEKVPGKHGEYYLKSELKSKVIEFEVVTPNGLTSEVKSELKRKIAEYLNPTKNVEKPLTFSDDLEKQYLVRYSGNMDIENYPQWFKFVIPFKLSNPLIRGSFDNILVGSGVIENSGNTNANMIISINGLADNPTIELDGETLIYNGTIEYGQTVIIDTEKKTVMMGDINVLDNWCGIFPTLKPGKTNAKMNGNISIRWRDAWL